MYTTPCRLLLFLVIIILSTGPLVAQDTTRTTRSVDQGTQMMLERSNLSQDLIFSGGFSVNNPDIDFEIEEDKLYLDPELRPHVITLVGGLKDTLLARIQLIDQLVEVYVDGKELQVAGKSLQSVTSENGQHFVAFRRPLVHGDPPPLMELLATYGDQSLYAYRRVELREPAQQKTPYDGDNYKKRLYRQDLLYLMSPLKQTQLKKLKELIALLPAEAKEEARRYAKKVRLRNREADYIKLLTHLEYRVGDPDSSGTRP